MSEKTFNIDNIKDWFTFIVAVIACVSGVIFWVQSADDPRFLEIERDVYDLKQDIKSIQDDNNEILRIIGQLEGKLENHH